MASLLSFIATSSTHANRSPSTIGNEMKTPLSKGTQNAFIPELKQKTFCFGNATSRSSPSSTTFKNPFQSPHQNLFKNDTFQNTPEKNYSGSFPVSNTPEQNFTPENTRFQSPRVFHSPTFPHSPFVHSRFKGKDPLPCYNSNMTVSASIVYLNEERKLVFNSDHDYGYFEFLFVLEKEFLPLRLPSCDLFYVENGFHKKKIQDSFNLNQVLSSFKGYFLLVSRVNPSSPLTPSLEIFRSVNTSLQEEIEQLNDSLISDQSDIDNDNDNDNDNCECEDNSDEVVNAILNTASCTRKSFCEDDDNQRLFHNKETMKNNGLDNQRHFQKETMENNGLDYFYQNKFLIKKLVYQTHLYKLYQGFDIENTHYEVVLKFYEDHADYQDELSLLQLVNPAFFVTLYHNNAFPGNINQNHDMNQYNTLKNNKFDKYYINTRCCIVLNYAHHSLSLHDKIIELKKSSPTPTGDEQVTFFNHVASFLSQALQHLHSNGYSLNSLTSSENVVFAQNSWKIVNLIHASPHSGRTKKELQLPKSVDYCKKLTSRLNQLYFYMKRHYKDSTMFQVNLHFPSSYISTSDLTINDDQFYFPLSIVPPEILELYTVSSHGDGFCFSKKAKKSLHVFTGKPLDIWNLGVILLECITLGDLTIKIEAPLKKYDCPTFLKLYHLLTKSFCHNLSDLFNISNMKKNDLLIPTLVSFFEKHPEKRITIDKFATHLPNEKVPPTVHNNYLIYPKQLVHVHDGGIGGENENENENENHSFSSLIDPSTTEHIDYDRVNTIRRKRKPRNKHHDSRSQKPPNNFTLKRDMEQLKKAQTTVLNLLEIVRAQIEKTGDLVSNHSLENLKTKLIQTQTLDEVESMKQTLHNLYLDS